MRSIRQHFSHIMRCQREHSGKPQWTFSLDCGPDRLQTEAVREDCWGQSLPCNPSSNVKCTQAWPSTWHSGWHHFAGLSWLSCQQVLSQCCKCPLAFVGSAQATRKSSVESQRASHCKWPSLSRWPVDPSSLLAIAVCFLVHQSAFLSCLSHCHVPSLQGVHQDVQP